MEMNSIGLFAPAYSHARNVLNALYRLVSHARRGASARDRVRHDAGRHAENARQRHVAQALAACGGLRFIK